MSIELVMPSNHLILCHPLLLLPSIVPSISVFSNESAFRIRWPNYWSFSFSISPSSEYPGLISFWIEWFDLLAVQGILMSLLQHHNLKASILHTQSSLWSNSHIQTSSWGTWPNMNPGCQNNLHMYPHHTAHCGSPGPRRAPSKGHVHITTFWRNEWMNSTATVSGYTMLKIRKTITVSSIHSGQFPGRNWGHSFGHNWATSLSLSSIGEGNGNHSSVLAWKIPGSGEPGGLPSLGSHKVRHDWSNLAAAAAFPPQALATDLPGLWFSPLPSWWMCPQLAVSLDGTALRGPWGSALLWWCEMLVCEAQTCLEKFWRLTLIQGNGEIPWGHITLKCLSQKTTLHESSEC